MANNIKGFAIAAGTGLAIGMGNNRKRPEVPVNGAVPERISSDATRLTGIEDRFDRNDRELAALRDQMRETRESIASVATVIDDKFAEVAREVPGMVEAAIRAQVDEMRRGLETEIQASVDATLSSFERAIDGKISARVAALEKGLVDQSGIITALSERALQSDANLQRLISAVEKLCERTEGRLPASSPVPASREDVPFEKHLSDAAMRNPGSATSAELHPAFVKEDDELRPRHRLSGYR